MHTYQLAQARYLEHSSPDFGQVHPDLTMFATEVQGYCLSWLEPSTVCLFVCMYVCMHV